MCSITWARLRTQENIFLLISLTGFHFPHDWRCSHSSDVGNISLWNVSWKLWGNGKDKRSSKLWKIYCTCFVILHSPQSRLNKFDNKFFFPSRRLEYSIPSFTFTFAIWCYGFFVKRIIPRLCCQCTCSVRAAGILLSSWKEKRNFIKIQPRPFLSFQPEAIFSLPRKLRKPWL